MTFVEQFKKRCREITGCNPAPIPSRDNLLTPDTLAEYEIVKRVGDVEKKIAFGLTLRSAEILMTTLQSKLTRLPLHENGSPLFELELYRITVGGRERHHEIIPPRFNPDTKWID